MTRSVNLLYPVYYCFLGQGHKDMISVCHIDLAFFFIGKSRYEGSLDPWMSLLWSSLYQINPSLFPIGVDVVPDMKLLDQSKVSVRYHVKDGASLIYSTTPGNLFLLLEIVIKLGGFFPPSYIVLIYSILNWER